MDPGAEEVHGFFLEKLYELSEGMEFLDQLQDFMKDFFDADFVIGHNVQFDIKFLKHELNSLYEVGMIDETWEPKTHFVLWHIIKTFVIFLLQEVTALKILNFQSY